MSSINNFQDISENIIWNSENIYHLKTDKARISKLISHYEIYKKITSIDGDIVECGVFKGISITRFLTFREILENNYSRKIYGFDVFGKFPNAKNFDDKKFLKNWEKTAGNGIDIEELKNLLIEKKFENFELVKGDVIKTIQDLVKNNPKLKISLLHLDMDIYEPTKLVIEQLFNYMSKGGIILIDDYNSVYGATKAIDEFINLNRNLEITKLKFDTVFSYFIEIK